VTAIDTIDTKIIVRLLTPADLDAYRSLRLSGILESPGVAWATHAEEAALPLEHMRQRLIATPYLMVFGAFIADRLVALGGLKREPMVQIRHRANIWGLYVEPAARGAGVAGQLLEAMREHARQIPELLQLTLVVDSGNHAAQSLYAKLGFIQTGIDRRSVCSGGAFHDEHRMVLFLDGDAGGG
jgi:RimJ/RimL family protein N-acetyltransferase